MLSNKIWWLGSVGEVSSFSSTLAIIIMMIIIPVTGKLQIQ